ncbi:MAG: type II secretion system protein [Planctomycetaceae bacterium]|nr:MAG: type II secretion system protein [Planctomycetaceae bacterium]
MKSRRTRNGFTLVELMVVIAIIGILMTLAVTAVGRAITRGRETAMRLEVNALQAAVQQYFDKYGDYPPDGSSPDRLMRHMRRLFPRMSPQDSDLLVQLTRERGSPNFSSVAMDRGEALVFFLGGFSNDPLYPLTGEGGPLLFVGSNPNDVADYDYNATRDNAFFEFSPDRLTYARNAGGRLLSTDEQLVGTVDAMHGFNDPLPAYLARDGNPTPIVYFDSQTYGMVGAATFNGYLAGGTEFGGVRPYLTNRNGMMANLNDMFMNPQTFQIISPGLDGIFGSLVFSSGSPVYFVAETGEAVVADGNGVLSPFVPAVRGFQEPGVAILGQLDNLTNFSTSTLESDLK